MVRVRFAPSPTGLLHIGGLRTALYNELFALRHKGVFVLRIEDTDRTRLVPGALENIIETLRWAGIEPQEGPYVQSARLEIYREHATKLVADGNAYYCFCSSERLEEMKRAQTAAKQPVMYDKRCRGLAKDDVSRQLAAGAPHVIRLRIPEGTTGFDDAIRGAISFENATIDDQVLMKSDGFPTYHLANVVDDHLMKITHVIRGEEWLPSTPKHVLLYRAFGWDAPVFAHVPLLLNPDRSKLSKRQGDVAVQDYRDKGYLPEALVNFIALLGWNPSGDREIYTKKELAKEFDLAKINKGGAVFNHEKLDWINGEYLKQLPAKRLAALALPFFERAGIAVSGEGETFVKALELERQRVKTLAELPEATSYFFDERYPLDAAIIPWKKSTVAVAKQRLEALADFFGDRSKKSFGDPKTLEEETLAFVAKNGWTNAETLWPLRVALTGRQASPSPFEAAWTLGKEKTLVRIRRAIGLL